MADRAYLAGSGAIWIQPDGPNSQPIYLGCHALGDIDHPLGDAELVFIPNVEQPNDYIPLDIYRSGGPGPVTTSIQSIIKSTADWLEMVACPVPVYVHKIGCGRMDVFENWDRSFILDSCLITNLNLTGMRSMTADDQDRSMQNYELSAKTMHKIFSLQGGQQNAVGVAGRSAISIAFSGSQKCFGQCGNVHSACQDGYIGLVGMIGTPSNVYYTDDAGLVWYPTAGNPFQTWEDVSGLANVQISTNSFRLIAARGTLDGLDPMEIAYSDDDGATWTNVDVGSVNGQYAIGRGNPLHAYNYRDIWLATTGGYIYYSDDAGASWTAQESGLTTVQNLHAVHFVDDRVGFAVGENNTILRTIDGENWTAIIGPASEAANTAQAVYVFNKNRFWVGYDSGNLWFTNDGGTTWFERNYPGSGSGEIQDIKFCNDYVGYIAHISAGGAVGSIFRTINGGWSWETQGIPAGTGPLYDLHVCNCNGIYAAGEF